MYMYYNKINISPAECLRQWGIEYKHSGKELLLKCVFSDCDVYKQTSRHLYMNDNTGVFCCFKCGAKGNLFTLAKHLGKELKNDFHTLKKPRSSKSLIKVIYVDY